LEASIVAIVGEKILGVKFKISCELQKVANSRTTSISTSVSRDIKSDKDQFNVSFIDAFINQRSDISP